MSDVGFELESVANWDDDDDGNLDTGDWVTMFLYD
jgi:hypothetical protein